MRLITKLQRNFQKKYFPTSRDLVMRRWRADKGDQTLRLSYPLCAESVVLDLGGYHGDWAHEIHLRYQCTIHVFEPVGTFADGIKHRFMKHSNVMVHEFGLGKTTRRESIGLSADATSLFCVNGPQESILLMDVVNWFSENNLHQVDLMKINIEGGEYELLERMLDADLASRVHDFQIQFHAVDSDSKSRMESILNRLATTHQPTFQYEFIWENWRRLTA